MNTPYKIVFTGPVGAGKTSAISALCNGKIVSTEEKATDLTALNKPKTTVAMDFGVFHFNNDCQLHLYGTPGQKRFNFMWDILSENCLGIILLLDSSSTEIFTDLSCFLEAFINKLNTIPMVIGITKGLNLPQSEQSQLQNQINIILKYYADNYNILYNTQLFFIDANKQQDVANLVFTLVSTIRNKG